MNYQSENVNVKLEQQLQWCLHMFKILQESSRRGSRTNGSAGSTQDPVTLPDMTEPPEVERNEHNVDWSRDDDDNDDITSTNADNERDTRRMNGATKKQCSDRKPSFNLFSGRPDRKNKELHRDEETTGVLRRPKRFFSQQNLRAVSKDESVFDTPVSTPRISPPKFLWRLVSHQKYQSHQDLPSVHEGVQGHDPSLSSNSRPNSIVGTVSSSAGKTRATALGKSPVGDVRLGPEGMEGDCCWVTEASSQDAGYQVKRDGDVQARVKCPSWSGWQVEDHVHASSHVNRVPQNVVMSHDLSGSGRFLGEYRPRLNTHEEEPTGAVSIQDVQTRAAGCRSPNRWSFQVPETFRDPTSPSHAFEGSPPASPSKTRFASVSKLNSDNMARPLRETNPDQRNTSSLDRLLDEPASQNYQSRGAEDLVSMEPRRKQFSSTYTLPPNHFKSASYDNGVGDHQRKSNVRRLQEQNSPSQFFPNQVQTLRQRSQEFYGDYSLVQRKAVSNADIFRSVRDQNRHTPGTDYRSDVVSLQAGRTRAPYLNSLSSIADSFRTGVGTPQQTNGVDPFQPGPVRTRSLSMSHLQSNTDNDLSHLKGRHPNRFNQSPSNAHQRVLANNTPGLVWLPGNGQDARYFKQMSPLHERGCSLDSSELDRSDFDPTLLRPCTEPRNSTLVEDQVFSNPEVFGNFKRRSCDQSERPLRYRISSRPGSGSGGDETTSKRVQQQAVLSLFQRLTLAKQQKMYDARNSCISSMGCRDSLPASEIQTRSSTGWNDGIQTTKNSLPQTLTDPNSKVSTGPELALLSTTRIGHQTSSVMQEKSLFDSHEDLNTEDGVMEPLRIDEPITHAPQFRLQINRHPEISDKLSSNAKVDYSSTDHTNHRDASAVHSRSQFTADHPSVFHIGRQTPNGTGQPASPASPPPLLPKSCRLQNYSLDRDGNCTVAGIGFDAEELYASQLRNHARKLSLSSDSSRTGSVSKRESLHEVSGDLGGCETGSFHHHLHHHQQQQQMKEEDGGVDEPVPIYRLTEEASNARSLKAVSELDPPSCDRLLTQGDSHVRGSETEETQVNNNCKAYASQSNSAGSVYSGKHLVQSESGRVPSESGRVHNESGRAQHKSGRAQHESGRVPAENGRVYSESGRVQREDDSSISEPCETATSHHHPTIPADDAHCNRTGSTSQPILPSTSDVTCSGRLPSASEAASLRIPNTPKGLPSRLNSSLPLKEPSPLPSSHPPHSLKDFPDTDSSSSTEDDSFRGLSSVLCRHLGTVDEELCSILRPPYVKASADFVRWIFENRKLVDLDLSGRLEQRWRTSKTSNEAPKDLKTPHSSLQTLKDELLVLVEKRLKRHLDRKQRLTEKLDETLQLEKKVTATVRQKTDRKQFEKFLSYLEQLEKVIQLLLNLSARLSKVERDLCHLSKDDGAHVKQKKQLSDKKHQILERLKEAMELKWSIDERSQQVSAFLRECLAPDEFNDFREMVRIRCHLSLHSQAIEDQTELALMQKKVLMIRCQSPQRQTPPPEMTQLQSKMTQMKPEMTQFQPETT